MIKIKTSYICSECQRVEPKWLGRCPNCGSWNSFEEQLNQETSKKVEVGKLSKLSQIKISKKIRRTTSFLELDRVLGNGLMQGSSTLIGGDPGVGKSTLLLQVACKSDFDNVLYISGEESASQIKLRADRLKLSSDNVSIYCGNTLEVLMQIIDKSKPDLIIVDSLQTLISSESSSAPGSVNQMKISTSALNAKAKSIDASIIFIAHVTKDGIIAGPKSVEHIVDTVLYFEMADQGVRIIRAIKNRFGSVDEIGLFLMWEEGLIPVEDPTTFFISSRNKTAIAPGISYTAIVEGSRTFLVEIQALVIESKSGYRRIYSEKIDSSKVSRIAAVLEKHVGIKLSDMDIYINVAGGIKLSEVSIELALALALYSAATNKSLDNDFVSIGEISLSAEIRSATFLDKRIKAIKNLGFKKALVPFQKDIKYDDFTQGVLTLNKAISLIKK